MKIQQGKFNMVIDGQFGSTGKGLCSSYVGYINHIDLAITNAAPNAGHTFYWHNKKYIVKHLPVSGIINKRSTIYLCAGAIINVDMLLKEMDDYNIDPCRIRIHPRAVIIQKSDIEAEQHGAMVQISSTQNGVGEALKNKISRKAELAKDSERLLPYVGEVDVEEYLDLNLNCLMEVPQGFDLGINSGLSYPYCTSRDITVSSAMADAQVHPSYLGNVFAVIRTFPIRVGSLEGGYSGPFYEDSVELSWEEVGVDPEFTTRTNRVRRVATFSHIQFERMKRKLNPDYILLNFANYLSKSDLEKLLSKLDGITHIGFGPEIKDIVEI